MDLFIDLVAINVEERIVKQFQYLTQHQKFLSVLNEKLIELQNLKERVQRMVEIERRNGNAIRDDVQFWLIEVDRIENEWQRFYDVEVAKKTCFGEQCPNLAFKYSLSKRAAEEIEKISFLMAKVGIFDTISYSPFFSNFREDIKISESREKYITEIIENLKDDRLKRISICGWGGMGKTTLAKNLVITLKTTRQFDAVAMAVVSQNPNYNNIQAEIADCLGFYFEGETLEERSMELNQRLKEFDDKKVKVLIVLDDVRQTLDFESIGLPSPDHQKGLKILLTSRSIDVCKQMGSEKNLLVPPLPDNEAWDLFREMAGDVVDIPDIYPIARQVVKELWGMPLAIVVIGRTLSQKEDVVVWKDALDQMKPEDMGLDRYSSTEISFKSLDNVHKSCLLLCSLFPKDLDIPVESLLRQGVGLGLFEATDAVWKERNRVNDLVNNLKSSSLLLDSEKPGCVRMHDVVRQEVLKTEHGISDTELKLLNQKQKQKEGKWLRMLLILDNKIELVKNDDPECPTLELIQVWSQNNEKELIISRPEELINGMSKLKVLVLKNLCIPKAAASLFHSSVNLHTLQLEGCDLGDISVIGKEFNKLEILSFANSNIKELPTEIGNLGSLRLLDLTGCDDLTIIAANVFARLSRLEELYFRVKKFPWMLNQDFVQELRNLSQQLTVLEIKVNIFPNDFIFGNLQKFWVSVVPYSTSSYEPPQSSNMLQLRVTDYETIKSTMQLVEKCEILILEKVKDLKNVSATGLKNVKDLRLHSCPNIQCVIDCTAPSSSCVLPLINSLSLEKLELKSLPNFIGFSNAIVVNEPHQPIRQESSFATEITDSTNIEPPSSISGKLFSSNWMKQFPKLKTLLLKDCISLEMVFDLKECSKSTGLALDYLFPKLGKIEISFLQKLSCVWGNVDQDSVQGFQNLRSLTISNCDSLKYVFTSVIARAIKNLEELKVSSCELIENIVWSRDDEGDNNKGHMQNIEFKKLKYLSLSRLPKLVSMCSCSLGLEFPSLRKFEIDDCPMLEISSLPIPTHVHAVKDTLHKTEDTLGFESLNENNTKSSSSTLPLGCFPFQPKFIREGNLEKKIRKEASLRLAQDDVPSPFGMKSRQEIVCMPVLDDLCVIKCDLSEVLFSVEENYNSTNPSDLKTIKVEKCDKLKTMVASRDKRKDVINLFAQLNSLHLKQLPNVESFYFFGSNKSRDKQQSKEECVGDRLKIRYQPFINECLFPKLTSLVIETCNKISILFSHSCLSSSLEHLEKLEVQHCENVEAIIPPEDIEASANKIMFPELQHLLLKGLPKLKAVNLSSHNCHFPSLQKVEIEDCPNMIAFSRGFCIAPKLEDVTIQNTKSLISHYTQRNDMNAIVQGFQAFVASQGSEKLNWTKLHNKGYFIKNSKTDIEAFDQLSVLIPFDEMPKLQEHVRELNVRNCGSLVEVFESQVRGGGTKEGDNSIHDQPKLSHIWKLTSLSIEHCHSLKSLFPNISMASSLPFLMELKVYNCDKLGEIIENNEQEQQNKVVVFASLTKIELGMLPSLKCFCRTYFPCYVEMPKCSEIRIQYCPEMETFWHNGILTTPILEHLYVEKTRIAGDEDVNDVMKLLLSSAKHLAPK